MSKDWTNELRCYSGVLEHLSAYRAAVSDMPPPKRYLDLEKHHKGPDYLASFLKEVDSFKKKHGMCLPPDIDIKDIPPELILQLMPLWHKKYEVLDFSKFKPYGWPRQSLEEYLRGSHIIWHGSHGHRQSIPCCRGYYRKSPIQNQSRDSVLTSQTRAR